MKLLSHILLFSFLFALHPALAQDGMFDHKKERRRVWRHWGRKKDAYNPYLSKKGKNKPSARIAKENKREQRRQKRQFKRQLKQAKRK